MNNKKKIPELIQYLKGDDCRHEISKEFPYNETDAVILASLCYIEFERITAASCDDFCMTVGAYAKFFQKTKAYHTLQKTPIRFHINQLMLVDAMVFNHRYSNLMIQNIVSDCDTKKVIQFTAMTIVLPDCGNGAEKVVVFRGTNESFNGWYEDILFAYAEEETAGQKAAKDYLNQIRDVDVIHLTGHSKGGHLAEYAGVFCNEEIRKKIVSVINLDGPGIRRDIKDKHKEGWNSLSKQLGNHWYSILPPSSVVGMCLSEPEYIKLVESSRKGLMQHDLFTWQFTQSGIQTSHKELDAVSKYLNQTLKDAMEQVSADEILQAFDPKYAEEDGDIKQERKSALHSMNLALQYAMAKNLGVFLTEKMDERAEQYLAEAIKKEEE